MTSIAPTGLKKKTGGALGAGFPGLARLRRAAHRGYITIVPSALGKEKPGRAPAYMTVHLRSSADDLLFPRSPAAAPIFLIRAARRDISAKLWLA